MATKNKVGLFLRRSAIVNFISCMLKGISSTPFNGFVNSLLTDCLVFLFPAARKRVEGQHPLQEELLVCS